MPATVQLLFNTPQREIASLIEDRLQRYISANLISGFVTVDGIASGGGRPEALASQIATELDVLLPDILDKAFKGEL